MTSHHRAAQSGAAPSCPGHMIYPALANHFWAKRLEHSFTCNDIAVYFALVDHCSALGWKNPFNFSVLELQVKVGLKTKDPLDTARNRLKQAGLIDYKNGDGRGRTTQYWLRNIEAASPEREGKRDRKNTPLSAPLSPPLSAPLSGGEKPTVHSSSGSSKRDNYSNTTPTTPPNARGEPGRTWSEAELQLLQEHEAWLQEHAPRMLSELDSRLTPADLQFLYSRYSQTNVRQVFAEWQQYHDLHKYRFADLKAKATTWCDNRAPAWNLNGSKKTGEAGSGGQRMKGNINDQIRQQRSEIPT